MKQRVIRIEPAHLDPITAWFIDHEPGKGEVIITCYGAAWTGYWGAMGSRDIVSFVRTSNETYLTKSFESEVTMRQKRSYLTRIIVALLEFLRSHELPEATEIEVLRD